MTKALIVEDQKATLEALEYAIKKVGPVYIPDLAYDVARCYNDAQKMIPNGYDIILLDHKMPRNDLGNLEDVDFRKFCASLESIGYSLIDYIKDINPEIVIIGTSSLSESELRGQPSPDYVMSKMWRNAEADLNRIFADINAKKSGSRQ